MRTRESKVVFTTTNFLSLFQIINQIQMFQTHCIAMTNGQGLVSSKIVDNLNFTYEIFHAFAYVMYGSERK